MEFTERLKQLAERIKEIKPNIRTEEATKTSMIMPFFQLLGYDVFNPLEFVPEFTADVGIKKGEKVDYAIVDEKGVPVILIEAKSCTASLDKHGSQLFRYFATTPAKFAILTNGITYRFYTDLGEQNKMDEKPFFVLNMFDIKESIIPELKKFQKSSFDVETIVATASELTYYYKIKQVLSSQLAQPDDEFVSFVLSGIYEGRKTKKTIDAFRDIVKNAFVEFISEKVNERLKTALHTEGQEPPLVTAADVPTEEKEPRQQTEKPLSKEETDAYNLIKSILESELEGHEITCKKTTNYFAINIDGNLLKWICRLYLGGEKRLILNLPSKDKPFTKRVLSTIHDVVYYKNHMIEIFHRHVSE